MTHSCINTIFYNNIKLFYYLTSQQMKQVKFAKSGYVSPMPGYPHAKNSNYLPKSIDLDGFSVQMLKPQFLQAKTLKRPLKEMDIHLKKTNPNGTRFSQVDSEQSMSQSHLENRGSNKNIKINQKLNQKEQELNLQFKFISCSGLNIQPAKRPKQKQIEFNHSVQLQFKDKNSVISALFKKGQLKTSTPIEIKVSKVEPSSSQKIGPAQAKLKSLYKKDKSVSQQPSLKKLKQAKHENEQIDQQINQSISEQYANESFQKMSGAYESQIKQSIRESIMGGSSGAIKESIHDQIPESIRSGQHSRIRQQVKEQIYQSLPKQNIQEQVYEEIFQQASISDEALKSKSNSRYLKKPKQQDKFELSVSASKGFRTKTTNVVKSIKFAQQLQIQKQIKNVDNKLQEKLAQGDKLAEQIIKQKTHFEKLQAKIASILNPHTIKVKRLGENKNLDLLHNFKIQVNRLITSENFMSKLRKLTAFLGSGQSTKPGDGITDLEDKLLNNLYDRIKDLRVSGVTQQQLSKTKKQYDEKLAYLLKQQQMSLKIEMDRKLHEKDMELKKMIAQLQQKMRTSAPISYIGGQPKKRNYGDKVEVDSDYSIDSDQVSWKMDLWQILPDYEKKKLYEKQGAEVAKFLTDVLMNEIKEQNLDRSADISFQFPQQFNTSNQYPKQNTYNMQKPTKQTRQDTMKPAFNRQQLLSEVKSKTTDKEYDFPPLPGVKKKAQEQSPSSYNIGFLQITPKQHENQVRDTLSVSQVVKILAKYKNLFLKKKNDLIKKLIKTFQSKTKADQPLSSILNELRILNAEQNRSLGKDEPYVKAYEQQLITELMGIFNRLKNRKNIAIEEEMKRMYDRLVVTCQIKTAEASVGNPIQIAPHGNYIDLKMAQQDKKVKDALVSQICNILALQFAKQMPKRK